MLALLEKEQKDGGGGGGGCKTKRDWSVIIGNFDAWWKQV